METSIAEKTSGGHCVQSVLDLETAGKAWGDFENPPGVNFDDAGADAALLHGFPIDAKELRRLDDWTGETFGASKN